MLSIEASWLRSNMIRPPAEENGKNLLNLDQFFTKTPDLCLLKIIVHWSPKGFTF